MRQTVTQWLNLLPEPYKSQSLLNILEGRHDRMCDTMSDAIDKSSSWSDTPQGHDYWKGLRDICLTAEANGIVNYEDAFKEHERREAEKLARIVTYSKSMREMLDKLSDDCRVSRILVNADYTNNSFCNYITTRNGMLSFLPNGREHKTNAETGKWLRDGRQEMKPAKLARKLMNESILESCAETDFEKFGNKVRAYLGIVGDEDGEGRNINLEVIQGDAITHAYNWRNTSDALGTGTNLHGSCMRSGDAQNYFDIYTENVDKVQMLVAKDAEGKILGRALLWNFDDGDKGMDTIYGPDVIMQVFKDWAIDNGYWYKSNQSCHHHDYNVFNTETFDRSRLSSMDKLIRRVTISNHDFDNYPYVDSLYYLCFKDGKYYLCNEHERVDKTLRSTSGQYEEYDGDDDDDDDYVTLENGDRCHTEDAHYLDYRAYDGDRIDGYYHESDVVFANCDNYYLREHCTRIGHTWYALDDNDIVYVDDRNEYFLEEDTVYCSVRELQIHVADSVELHDGDYCDKEYAWQCIHDGQWYLEDDVVKLPNDLHVATVNMESYLEQIKQKENETEREGITA